MATQNSALLMSLAATFTALPAQQALFDLALQSQQPYARGYHPQTLLEALAQNPNLHASIEARLLSLTSRVDVIQSFIKARQELGLLDHQMSTLIRDPRLPFIATSPGVAWLA